MVAVQIPTKEAKSLTETLYLAPDNVGATAANRARLRGVNRTRFPLCIVCYHAGTELPNLTAGRSQCIGVSPTITGDPSRRAGPKSVAALCMCPSSFYANDRFRDAGLRTPAVGCGREPPSCTLGS